MDELSSEKEIKDDEVYRSVRSASGEESKIGSNTNQPKDKIDNNIEIAKIAGNQQIYREVEQKARGQDIIRNANFGNSGDQESVIEKVMESNSSLADIQADNEIKGKIDRIIPKNFSSHLNQPEKANDLRFPARFTSSENLNIIKSPNPERNLNNIDSNFDRFVLQSQRHSRAQTIDLQSNNNPLQQINQQFQNYDTNLPNLVSHQIPKNQSSVKKAQQIQLKTFDYVKAQQNNLFKPPRPQANLQLEQQQVENIKNSYYVCQSSMNQSRGGTTLNHAIGKIANNQPKKLISQAQGSNQNSSLLKKKEIMQGYDFSSIIADNQKQQYLMIGNENDKMVPNSQNTSAVRNAYLVKNFTMSDCNTLIDAIQWGEEPSEQQIVPPSFIQSQYNESQSEIPFKYVSKEKEKIQYSPQKIIKEEVKEEIKHNGDETFIKSEEGRTPEELGEIVKQVIENARQGQIINLPDCHIKVPELLILRPITIKGKPGTILEITHGSIVVDFDREEKYKDVLQICECHIIFSDRAYLIDIKQELDKEEIQDQHNDLNSNMHSNPINKSSVVIIQRSASPNSKAALDVFPLFGQGNTSNNERSFRDKNQMTGNNNGFVSQYDLGNGLYPLFQIKNQTFMEIRDCCLISMNKQAVMDAAFVMNEKDIYNQQYRGILSVKSCSIQNFSFGFLAGSNSILSVELSCITDCRQTSIYIVNPKIFKLSGTTLDSIDGNGIELIFKQSQQTNISTFAQTAQQQCQSKNVREPVKKIFIEDNKIQNCKESGLFIHSINDKNINCSYINAMLKLQNNRICNNKFTGITLKRLRLISLDIINCEISNNCLNNVMLNRVKTANPDNFLISKCRIADSQSSGIVAKDCQSICICECEIIKNKLTGIMIFDTTQNLRLSSRKQSQQKIDNSNLSHKVSIMTFEKIPTLQKVTETQAVTGQEVGIEESINRNINTGRIINNQGSIMTSGNRFENISNNFGASQNQGMSTQPNNTGVQLKHYENEGKRTNNRKMMQGMVMIIKCRIQDNKEHGISLEEIYYKTVEICKCKIRDNFMNGINIAQDLEPEDEVKNKIQNFSSVYDNIQKNEGQATSDRKMLIMRKDIISYSKVLITNSEIALNKLHGIQMGYTRTTIVDTMIVDNMQCAIKLSSKIGKLLLRLVESNLSDQNKEKLAIKGKIGGEWGEIIQPQKEVENGEQSELSRLLHEVNEDEEEKGSSQNIDVVSTIDKKKADKKHSNSNLKCFAKQSKKEIERFGDYLIIQEAGHRAIKKSTNKKSCGLLSSCISPSNKKSNDVNHKDNGCIII